MVKATRHILRCSHHIREKCSKRIVSSVKEMYGFDNLVEEALVWYDMQKHKPLDDNSLGMIELVKTTIFPAMRKSYAHRTDCLQQTIQWKSFGTLHRVKIWLRSTMSDTRLSGLPAMQCPPRQSEQPDDRANERGH